MPDPKITQPNDFQATKKNQAYILTGTLSKILRLHFSRNTELPDGIKNLKYSDNVAERRIDIVTRDEVHSLDYQRRPSIIVRRNSMTSQRIGIGEGRLSNWNSDRAVHHNTLYVGSHTLLCCSPIEAESELIAFESQLYINRFQHQIRRGLCMLRLRVSDIGQTGILRESRQVFATPFNISYAYDQPFAVYPVSPDIRFVNANTKIR